ncbi:MAG: SDR family oxidoreductase [Chloroflexi bacterium]|nr:SDR family oxidoreductase [Chloroflexota bacterium]
MKIMILGGSGMLGHKLWQVLADQFDTYVTLRQGLKSYARYNLFDRTRTIDHVSVQDFDSVVRAIAGVRPQVVVNCIGVVKQHAAAKDPLVSIAVNALFPHRLAQVCRVAGSRLVHISTDCVFSGRKGDYVESDVADAEDLYGRTKFLGEVSCEGCLTLRTSMVGRELETSHGLIEWFLSQEGKTVRGYTRAIFSGFTTNALAEIIAQIITEYPDLQGVWHVASEPISKFELLSLVKRIYGLNIQIEPDETVVVDRSLNADRFRQATGFVPPSWLDMIEQMYRDPTPYSELRRSHANG